MRTGRLELTLATSAELHPSMTGKSQPSVDLYWLPLGAGGHSVRLSFAEGAVGSRWARSMRIFRYENRRWRDGVIPDADEAVDSPQRLTDDPLLAQLTMVTDVRAIRETHARTRGRGVSRPSSVVGSA